ncbi:odorant receptor Or2-like [Schistocerca americana]|uniref:odorant receptor Or2-like n=1 Tax=Schistocerca americana TaxID=7009 RepID=UPI001F4F22C1|nr:odorant receptor Or2-like [Schistocerca americana]
MEWDSQAVEPLTWQYAAGSVLQYNLRWLHAFGVWPLSGSPLFRIFTVTISALSLGHIAEGVVHLCTLRGDLEDYTLSLSCLSIMVVGSTKATFFLCNEAGYCRLVRWLDALVNSQREYVRSRSTREAIFEEVQRRGIRISKAFNAYNISLLSIWFVAPLMSPEKRLPFQQLPVTNTTILPMYAYELSYALQVVSMFFVGLIHVQMDSFFIVVMFHISAQLKILSERIADLQLLRADKNELFESNENKRLQKSMAAIEAYKQLCLCIRTHQDITRFIGYLESVMNPIAMMQLAIGVFNGCMMIFPAAYSVESGALLKELMCAPTVSMQLLLYCVGAHSVREQGELVSMAAYSCDWPDTNICFQKKLLLVMVRGQRPLTLTAGGIYPIQRGTFLSSCFCQRPNYAIGGHEESSLQGRRDPRSQTGSRSCRLAVPASRLCDLIPQKLLNAGYSYYAVLKNFAGR